MRNPCVPSRWRAMEYRKARPMEPVCTYIYRPNPCISVSHSKLFPYDVSSWLPWCRSVAAFRADNASRIYIEYIYIYIHAHGFPLFSTVLSSVYQRAHRSSLRSRFFIGIPGTKKNIVRRDWKAIPSSGNEPLSLLSTSLSQLVFHAPGSSCITRQSIWIRGILPSDIAFLLEGGGNQSSGFLIWEFLGVKGRERCLSLESFEFTQLKNWVAKFNSWN